MLACYLMLCIMHHALVGDFLFVAQFAFPVKVHSAVVFITTFYSLCCALRRLGIA